MPPERPWSTLLLTFRNRPFRWLLLAIAGVAPISAYWLVTVQAPLAAAFAWPMDGTVYLGAAATLASGGDPYAGFNASWSTLQGAYIYPPLLAWTLQPLTRLSKVQADTVMLAGGHLLLLGTLAAALSAFRVTAPWRAFAYLLLFLGFEPNWDDLILLQASPLLAFSAALWVLAWSRGSRLGGVAAGAGIAVKLLVAPVLALPLLRRRWADLGLAAATVAALSLVAAPRWLPEYLTRVLPAAGQTVGSVANVAPAGIAAWIVAPATFYGPDAPGSPLPQLAGAAFAAVILGLTLWRLRAPAATELGRGAQACALVAALPLLSTLTWPNHLCIVMVAMVGCLEVAWLRRDAVPAILAGTFWLLLGPGHLLLVNALLAHQGDPSVARSIATHTVQPGWDLALRAWGLTGPLALVCLWLGALRAASPSRLPRHTPTTTGAQAASGPGPALASTAPPAIR